MHKIIIITVGKWKFAVREEDISMISDFEKQPVERWQNSVAAEVLKDMDAINESQDNKFINYIYFFDRGKIFCLGVDSLCYPANDREEKHFYFGYSGVNDGIIGLYTQYDEILSIVDLGKFLERWLRSASLAN